MKAPKKSILLSIIVLHTAMVVQAKHVPGHLDTSHIKAQTSVATQNSKHVLGGKGHYQPRAGKAEIDPTVASKSVEISEMARQTGLAGTGTHHLINSKEHLLAAKQQLKHHKQAHKKANKDLINLKSASAHGIDNTASIADKEEELDELEAKIQTLESQINAYKKEHAKVAAPKRLNLQKVSRKHSATARAAHRGK